MSYFSGKRILLISPEPWGRSMLSKHHYAAALAAAGARVFFLTPPHTAPLHDAAQVPPGITLVTDRFAVRGSGRLPALLRRAVLRPAVRRMEKEIGGPVDIVWSFDNSRWFDLDLFHAPTRIHHLMDFHADHHLADAARSSTMCIGVTPDIVQRLAHFQPAAHFLQHGYAPTVAEHALLPPVSGKVRALYAGNLLRPFIHWGWMLRLAMEVPEVHFFFAGSTGGGNLNKGNEAVPAELGLLERLPNVSLLGESDLSTVQAWMEQADLLFFAYRYTEYPEILANSLKLMSYLGAGKVIAGNPVEVFRDRPDLLLPCTSAEALIATVRDIARDPGAYNTPEAMERRRSYALAHQYPLLLEQIAGWLEERP